MLAVNDCDAYALRPEVDSCDDGHAVISVPVNVPAEISRRRFVHRVGDSCHSARDVMLEAVLADEVQQFLQPRNLHHTGAAERRKRIIGESPLADVAANTCRCDRRSRSARMSSGLAFTLPTTVP